MRAAASGAAFNMEATETQSAPPAPEKRIKLILTDIVLTQVACTLAFMQNEAAVCRGDTLQMVCQ